MSPVVPESALTLLAIESSCDETAAAVLRGGKLLSQVIATQEIHALWGGVVPELASRAHHQQMVPVVQTALKQAGVDTKELHAVAFTQGPGLLGALLVGMSFAKGLALALDVPLIGVNHLRAHILAHMLTDQPPSFPFLCLTVSGGHTQLVRVDGPLQMHILGETQDDAVGEAFDKIAKVMGFPYPGGPHLDKLAQMGNPQAFAFPTVDMPGLSYSFSGLKTAFINFKQKHGPEFIEANKADVAASIQQALVNTLLTKLRRAARETGIKTIAIAGGVAANSGLRSTLLSEAERLGWQVHIPPFAYCTDNAAMIGITAHYQYLAGDFVPQNCEARVRWALG